MFFSERFGSDLVKGARVKIRTFVAAAAASSIDSCRIRARMIFAIIAFVAFLQDATDAAVWGHAERSNDRCEAVIEEIVNYDRATSADDTPSRLYSTWLSQECEVRAGLEYVIRKYTFFENGTFLLLRHHYAEESCSVATHTVTARGSIKLLSPSILTPGATEARFYLDSVHIVPLNRQVAHKFGHRLNVTCGPQPRWKPYIAQPVYENPSHFFPTPRWYAGPRYNSHQAHSSTPRKQHATDCLEPLGVEFGELRLLRVQKRPSTSGNRPRVELLLGSLPPNVRSKWLHRPTSLQPTALLRVDTTSGCPICGSVARGTEYSPPLLHEVAALPALLGGFWLSSSCESIEGGLWSRRQLQIFAGDKLWTGRWDYYDNPRCTGFLYAITAAGSYVQRAGRQRRHGEFEMNFDRYAGDLQEIKEIEPPARKHFKSIHSTDRTFDDSSRDLELLSRANEFTSHSDEHPRILDIPDGIKVRLEQDNAQQFQTQTLSLNFESQQINPTDEVVQRNSHRAKPRFFSNSATKDKLLQPAKHGEAQNSSRLSLASGDQNTYSTTDQDVSGERNRRSLDEGSYRHLLQNAQPSIAASYAAMLRGNQRQEETTRRPATSNTPAGTTELDLHVAESVLIPGDASLASRCGGSKNMELLTSWSRNCVPKSVEAPSTLGLRARVGVSWGGQYTLLLGPRDDNLWDAPLRQCGHTNSHNPGLRAHLRRSLGFRYGLYSAAAGLRSSVGGLTALQIVVYWLYHAVLR